MRAGWTPAAPGRSREWKIGSRESHIRSSPGGNRTRFSALRGRCPEPVDDGAIDREWVVKELNLSPTASQFEGNGFTDRREEHHPVDHDDWHEWESNPQVIEVWAWPLCRFAYRAVLNLSVKAPSMGFEPTISTLTGWRGLRTPPQGLVGKGVTAKQLKRRACLTFCGFFDVLDPILPENGD